MVAVETKIFVWVLVMGTPIESLSSDLDRATFLDGMSFLTALYDCLIKIGCLWNNSAIFGTGLSL